MTAIATKAQISVRAAIIAGALSACSPQEAQKTPAPAEPSPLSYREDPSRCWRDSEVIAAPPGGCAPPLEPYMEVEIDGR